MGKDYQPKPPAYKHEPRKYNTRAKTRTITIKSIKKYSMPFITIDGHGSYINKTNLESIFLLYVN